MHIYRYEFSRNVPTDEVESSLVISILSVESIYGPEAVRLDVSHYFDSELRRCVIDASTSAGRDLNKLFIGFLRREFGEDSFRVERVDSHPKQAD